MIYYHVSSLGYDGATYLPDHNPNQSIINQLERLDVSNYSSFIYAYETILDNIHTMTNIRKTKWCCELIFEFIRKEYFPSAPRRLHSIYLCSTIDEAMEFMEVYRKDSKNAKIFSIEIEGEVHKYDMQFFTDAEQHLYANRDRISKTVYDYIKTCAWHYWNNVGNAREIEYLYEGEVKLNQILIDEK